MTKPQKLIVNIANNTEEYIDLTDEEIAELDQIKTKVEAEKAEREAEAKTLADAKTSALAKLAALGLTEDEAKAIVG